MSINRLSGALAACGLLALAALTGCSSGGGSVNVGAQSGTGNNTASRFVPNYAGAVTFEHWDHFPIKVAFTNDVTFGGNSLRSVALAGFDKWVQGTGGVTSYTVVSDPATADVTVTFQNVGTQPANGTELGNAQRDFIVNTNQIGSGIITLNYWPGISSDQVNNGMKVTAAHEYGHILGIVGHSPNSADIMFAAGSGSTDKALTQTDVNTIKTDYDSRF